MKIQPPAVLIAGAAGAGKTDSLATYIEAGRELFVLSTEPGGMESLLDSCERRKLSIDKLHWATALPSSGAWSAMKDMITQIGANDYESITKIKSGIGKSETRGAAMKFLENLSDFKCERTGQSYGDISTWDDSRAFALDSLSGLSMISWHLTLGYKPAAHQGEWGIAMNFIEQILLKITSDRNCHLAVTSHVEKEINELTGVNQIMVSTLGKKLAPKIPKYFSEYVYAKKTPPASFTWSTIDKNMDLKNRALTVSESLPPSFVPIVEAYEKRKKAVAAVAASASAPAKPAA